MNKLDQTTDENFIFITDLGLAVSLITTGARLITLNKANLKKAVFVFARDETIERNIEDYWTDILDVKARSLFDNLKMVKNRLHN